MLGPASPNPFAGSTALELDIPRGAGPTTVAVYDAVGRIVRTLASGLSAGRSTITWDGTDDAGRPLASGVYFVALNQEGRDTSRKVVLVR
jgi:flagellar hook assembly protein FlgD